MSKETRTSRPMERFWNLLRPDRQEIVNVYIYSILNGLVYLTIPLGIQAIINLIQVGSVNTSWIVLVFIVIIGVTVHGLLQIFQIKITETLQQKIFARAAFDFAYRIPRFKLESIHHLHAPELMNRFFDVLTVQKGLSKVLIDFSTGSVQVLVGLLILSLYHPFFAFTSIFLVLFVYLVFKWTAKNGLRTSLKESEYKYQTAYWLQELARANVTFKLAGNSTLPLDKTDRNVKGYIHSRESHFKVLLSQYSLMIIFKVLVAFGLLFIGGLLVMNGEMNIGQFVASEIIVLMIMGAVEKLIFTVEVIYDVLTALEKIGQVTDAELEPSKEGYLNINEKSKGISVELKDVNFKFPGDTEYVLKNIDLSVAQGEKVILCADNDQSARALLYIAAALLEPSEGMLMFNNLTVSNWNVEELRTYTGDSLRKDMLFHGSIMENISMNRPQVTKEEVINIANRIALTTEVKTFESGFDTILQPESMSYGKNFIQKIILARAIAGSPKLLVLKDQFMKLDRTCRESILEILFNEMKDTTVIIASSNKELFGKVDTVVHIEDAKVANIIR